MNILSSSAPIFIIILLSFILGRSQALGKEASDILARIVFFVIMPITLFFDLAKLPINTVLIWPYMMAFFISSMCVALITLTVSHYWFKRTKADLVINTMGATHTNTAYVALPLFLFLFNTVAPVASIIIVQAIFYFIFLFVLDAYHDHSHKTKRLAYRASTVLWKNPILIGILLGLLTSYFHLRLTTVLTNTLQLVSQSAAFLALFTLGLGLSLIKTKPSKREAQELGFLTLQKTLLHPAVSFIIGFYALHLSGLWLTCLVLISAMPTAKNLFIFAKRYHVGENRASLIVLFTTVISVLTINVILLVKTHF